jgi:hypothetical protein
MKDKVRADFWAKVTIAAHRSFVGSNGVMAAHADKLIPQRQGKPASVKALKGAVTALRGVAF